MGCWELDKGSWLNFCLSCGNLRPWIKAALEVLPSTLDSLDSPAKKTLFWGGEETFNTGRELSGFCLCSEEQQLFYIKQSQDNEKDQRKIWSTRTEMHISHSDLKPANVEKLIHVGLRGELWVLSLIPRQVCKGRGAKGQRYDGVYEAEEQKCSTGSRGDGHNYLYHVQLQTFHITALHWEPLRPC